MWWDEKTRQWLRHPECHCNHAIDQPCTCAWLAPLDAQGKPILGTVSEDLGRVLRHETTKKRGAA